MQLLSHTQYHRLIMRAYPMRATIVLAFSGVCLYTYIFSTTRTTTSSSLRSTNNNRRELFGNNSEEYPIPIFDNEEEIMDISTDGLTATSDSSMQQDDGEELRSVKKSTSWLSVQPKVEPRIMSPIIDPPKDLEWKFPILSDPQPYPLRDLSNYPNESLETWYHNNEQFSDLSQCMDFKCNKDVDVCDSTSPTTYNNPNGPCCTHILRDMLHVIDDSMATLGLDYFVGFGTLLGLTRSGKVIPWTADNDIVLEKRALRAMTELWSTESTGLAFISAKMGPKNRGVPRMCITPYFAGGKLQQFKIPTAHDVDFADREFPYIDFYFGKAMGMIAGYETYGGEYKSNGKPCRHFRSDIFPTKRQWAYDGQFALNFPAQPEQLLQRYYGLGWRIPLTDDSSHGKPREICDTNYGVEELEELEREYVMEGSIENN